MTSEEGELLFAQLARLLAHPTDRRLEPEGELLGRLSDEAMDVLRFAVEEARRLNHNYVGTEHLLLGLVRDPHTAAGRLLADLGVGITKVRDAVELIIGHGERTELGEPSFTPRARSMAGFGLRRRRRKRPSSSTD